MNSSTPPTAALYQAKRSGRNSVVTKTVHPATDTPRAALDHTQDPDVF